VSPPIRHLRFAPPAGLFALLAALALLLGSGRAVRAALMVADPPYRPKDFTIVKKDGLFHVFYIRHNVLVPNDSTEVDFGHAVSPDLYTWQQLPPVIAVRESSWDNAHVWAPSIVERDGVYSMFYTGLTSGGAYGGWQRIGLATSTNLMDWTRLDQPVYSCMQVPWAWCDSTDGNTGFRDPFVMPDPTTPGRWLMYVSTFPGADTTGMIVDVGASTGDFTQWTDLMPLWITNYTYSYNTIVESPHLFPHGNLWFLFFTTNSGQPISYAISHSPISPIDDWVYEGRLAYMLGVNTNTWIASEHFMDGIYDYFAYVRFNRIEIYKMLWNADGQTFQLIEPGAFHVSQIGWSSDTTASGRCDTLRVVASGWNSQTADLEGVERLPGGTEVAVSLDSMGIPSSVPLTGDTTFVPWQARILHASGDTTAAETLVVRMKDRTACSPPMVVGPPAAAPPDTTPPPDPVPDGEDIYLRGGFPHIPRATRSDDPTLLVGLPRPMQARLEVFDLQGRRVRTLADGLLPRGVTRVTWDGRDAGGFRVRRGVYFARLRTARVARTARILWVP
jgi:hypothetical protein